MVRTHLHAAWPLWRRAIERLDRWYKQRGILGQVSQCCRFLAMAAWEQTRGLLARLCAGSVSGQRRPGRVLQVLAAWHRLQVVDFTFENGIVELTVGEAVVGGISLAFTDPQGNGPNDTGATRSDVVSRHFTTQPGERGCLGMWCTLRHRSAWRVV